VETLTVEGVRRETPATFCTFSGIRERCTRRLILIGSRRLRLGTGGKNWVVVVIGKIRKGKGKQTEPLRMSEKEMVRREMERSKIVIDLIQSEIGTKEVIDVILVDILEGEGVETRETMGTAMGIATMEETVTETVDMIGTIERTITTGKTTVTNAAMITEGILMDLIMIAMTVNTTVLTTIHSLVATNVMMMLLPTPMVPEATERQDIHRTVVMMSEETVTMILMIMENLQVQKLIMRTRCHHQPLHQLEQRLKLLIKATIMKKRRCEAPIIMITYHLHRLQQQTQL
jgi:hypothetical protein